MGTLAHCLKLHDIPRGQARQIEEWARQYRDEGYPGPDATAKAVQDLIARTTKDRDSIVASVKEEAPAEVAGTATAETPVAEKVEPPKPAGPTPIPKVQGREFYSLPRAVTPAQDAAYLAAVEKGDMATAQRMVDEAAKKAGYTRRWYHGTRKDITRLRTPRYPGVGALYLSDSPHFAGFVVAGREGKMLTVYSRASNTFDAANPGHRKQAIEAGIFDESLPGRPSYNRMGPDKTSALAELGFDSAYEYESDGHRTQNIQVFRPDTDVRLADPVTYDDAGKVIPLSKRFDETTGDIRYSLPLAKETVKVWHGGEVGPKDWKRGARRGFGTAYFNTNEDVAKKYALGGGIDKSLSVEDYERKYKELGVRPGKWEQHEISGSFVDLDKLTFEDIVTVIGRDRVLERLEEFSAQTFDKYDNEQDLAEFLYNEDWSDSFAQEDTNSLHGNEEGLFVVGSNLIFDLLKKTKADGWKYRDAEAGGTTYAVANVDSIRYSAPRKDGERIGPVWHGTDTEFGSFKDNSWFAKSQSDARARGVRQPKRMVKAYLTGRFYKIHPDQFAEKELPKALKAGYSGVELPGGIYLVGSSKNIIQDDDAKYSIPVDTKAREVEGDKYQRVIDPETGKPIPDMAGWLNRRRVSDPELRTLLEQMTAGGYPERMESVFRRYTEQEIYDRGVQAYLSGSFKARSPADLARVRNDIIALGAVRMEKAEALREATIEAQNSPSINNSARLARAIQELYAAHVAVQGQKTEAGRALRTAAIIDQRIRAGEMTRKEQLIRTFAERGWVLTEAELEQLEALNDKDPAESLDFLNDAFNKRAKFTFWDWVDAYRYFNMLSGTNTHAYNFSSNTGWRLQDELAKALATGADVLKSVGTGQREMYFRDLAAGWGGYLEGLALGARAATQIMRRGYSDVQAEAMLEDMDKYRGPREAPGKIGAVLNVTGRLLAASDAIFSTAAYRAAQVRLATRKAIKQGATDTGAAVREILADPKQAGALHEEATKEARRSTFTDDAVSQKLIGYLQRNYPEVGRVIRLLIPFARVAENITRRGVAYTPGLGAMRSWKGEGKAQQIVGEQLVGLGILWLAYALAEAGKVTGAPPDNEDERDRWYRAGNQPYSVNIGGTWLRWNRMGPVAFPFAAGLALRERNKKGLAKDQSKVLADIGAMSASLGQMMVNMSILQSIGQLAYAINDPGKYGNKAVGGVVGQFVPAAAQLRQWEKAFDPTLRDPQKIYEKWLTGIPMADAWVAPRYDKLGQTVKRMDTGAAAFSPLTPIRPDTDPIWKILDDLEIDLDRPGPKWKEKDGTETILTNAEFNEFRQDVGRGVREAVVEHIKMNPGYTKQSLQRVVDRTQNRLKKRWRRDYRESE